MHALAWVVIVALGAFATIRSIRTLLAGKPIAERKPIACDLCMSTWASLAGAGCLVLHGDVGLFVGTMIWPASTGLTLFTLMLYDSLIPVARLPE